MPAIRQPSFAAGELAPALWGRTDLPRYAAGLRRCFNFFVSRQGNAVSRAGAQWLGTGLFTVTTQYNGSFEEDLPIEQYLAGDVVKLVPFLFSDTPTDPSTGTSTEQNYVLVFGNLSLMILKNGASLAFTLSGVAVNPSGAIIPYLASDLYKLRWAQSGDTLNLTCAGYPPATLKRVGTDATWTYAQLDFTRPTPQTLGLPTAEVGARLDEGQCYNYVPTLAESLQLWSWKITELVQDALGNVSESAPARVGGAFQYGELWNAIVAFQANTVVLGNTIVDVGHGTEMLRGFYALGNLPAGTPLPVSVGVGDPNWHLVQEYQSGSTYNLHELVSDEKNFSIDGSNTPSKGVYRSLASGNIGNPLTDATRWMPVGNGTLFQLDTFATDIPICVYADMPQTIYCQQSIGAYASGTSYARWAIVSVGSQLYQSQVAGNVGNPYLLTAFWMPVTLVGYRIYRGRAGIFGWVGDSAGPTWIDTGTVPDLGDTPPEGLDPFVTAVGAETPTAVTYFQDRLCYAGLNPTRPVTVLGSAMSDYNNFDQHLVSMNSDAVNFNLLARKREHVRSLIAVDTSGIDASKMFVLTSGGVWAISGAQGSPFAAESVDARVYSDIGSDWPVPLVVEGHVIYARDRGTGVRSFQFDWQRGGYTGESLSDIAEHLFLAYSISDWTYSLAPWGLIWLARDDGYLLTGTRCTEDGSWAWGQHQIQGPVGAGLGGQKNVISVCSITEGQEDVVYLAIEGSTLVTATWLVGTTYALGNIVNDGAGNLWRSQQNGNIGHALASGAWWLPYGSSTGPAYLLRFSTRQILGRINPVCLDFYLQAINPAVVGGNVVITLCSDNLSVFPNGHDFLGSKWMAQIYSAGIADAIVSGPYTATVSAGNIILTIPINAQTTPDVFTPSVVNIGFPYNCELELLDLAEGRTQRKQLTEVDFEVIGAGTLQVGADSLHLMTSEPINANNQLLRVEVSSDGNTAGRAFLRQPNPVPVTVVGVTRRASFDEDPG